MNEIRKIRKRELFQLLDDASLWNGPFLAISKHRLRAHFENPTADDDDIVLLLAYSNAVLVGYMGAFIDRIVLDGIPHKIAWLSTWWVDPATKGSGIGREILNTMHEAQQGKIGISQFTPSAKRVYDKSGYFTTLKESPGIKAVWRSDIGHLAIIKNPKLKSIQPVLRLTDMFINFFVSIKMWFSKRALLSRLENVKLDYLDSPDKETIDFIRTHSNQAISPKSKEFFEWLKAHHWVQEAPVLELTKKEKYEFSMYDRVFSVYFVKVMKAGKCIGFLVLQRRNQTMKVLFAYYEPSAEEVVSNVIQLHGINQKLNEVICYDPGIVSNFKRSGNFLYKKSKLKQSIISKVYGKTDFTDVEVNFGDGDCSFA